MAFGKPCPDCRCRDRDLDNGAEQHSPRVVPGEQGGPRRTRPAHHDDAGKPGEQLWLVPCGHFLILVRTDNEVERGTRIQDLESGKGFYRVGRAGSEFLNPT
jgi:hypothetical protein